MASKKKPAETKRLVAVLPTGDWAEVNNGNGIHVFALSAEQWRMMQDGDESAVLADAKCVMCIEEF